MCKTDYDKYKEIAEDIQSTMNESWKYVETLQYAIATGSLALSITLITVVIDQQQAINNKWLIITSWICLTLSIVANFISHIISYIYSGKAKSHIYRKMENDEKYSPNDINLMVQRYNTRIFGVNIFSIIIMLFGVLGILAFYICQIYIYK